MALAHDASRCTHTSSRKPKMPGYGETLVCRAPRSRPADLTAACCVLRARFAVSLEMPKKTICCVVGCINNSYTVETEGVSYFKLPSDKNRAKIWLQAMGNPPARNKMLFCELHFTKKSITQGNQRRRLRKDVMPTLGVPDPAVAEARRRRWRAGRVLVADQTTQTLPAQPENKPPDPPIQPIVDIFIKEETVIQPADTPAPVYYESIPIKQEPDEGVQPQPPDDSELDLLIKLSRAHLSPELARFIKVQVVLKSRARPCGEEMLLFALKLFHKYPQKYRLMFDTLGLPPVGQFKRLFPACALDELWARTLARRFLGVAPLARDCVLCVARSPLRRTLRYDEALDRLAGLHEVDGTQWPCAACSAVVVVARGIHARWRQPLAFCMLGAGTDIAKLRHFINRLISKLFKVGLIVRALVTDFDNAFATTTWPVTSQQPFYNADVGSHKWRIFSFYDCTLLMLRFRDIFMQYDINFDGMIASWGDILKLYEYDKKRARKLAPRLTLAHVQPAADARQAALAVEALAPAVGDALDTAVDRGVLGEAARGTARLVSLMGRLYETLHSKDLYSRGPGSSSLKNVHAKFLTETLSSFDKISLVNKEKRAAMCDPGVIPAWRVTTRAALALLDATRATAVAVLPMRAINNDPLEDFFRQLRAINDGENPTSAQFLGAFKKSLVFHALKPLKPPECDTVDQFLNAACEVASVPCAAPAPERPEAGVPRKHLESLPPLPVVAVRRLLAARLLELCLAEHAGCARMDEYCHSPQLPAGFRRFLELLEGRFRAHMSGSRAAAGLLAGLLRLVASERFDQPCACFPLLYLKSLFMRYRIRSLTHYNNHRLIGNKGAEFELDFPFRYTERWGED